MARTGTRIRAAMGALVLAAAVLFTPAAASAAELEAHAAPGPCEQQASGVRAYWSGGTLYAQNCNTYAMWLRPVNRTGKLTVIGPCSWIGSGSRLAVTHDPPSVIAVGWASC